MPLTPTTRFATLVVVLLALGAARCAPTPPERQLIQGAAAALGGADRILTMRTLTLEGNATNGSLGQAFSPDGPLWEIQLSEYARAIDLEHQRLRVQHIRTVEFPFPLQPVTRVDARLDGDVAFAVTADGMTVRNNARVAAIRRIEMLHHPVALLRAALTEGATVSAPRTEGGRQIVDVTPAGGGDPVTVAIDPATKLPASATSRAYDLNLGDVDVVTTFAEYETTDGLTLPRRVTSTIAGLPQWDVRVTRNVVDGENRTLAAPPEIRAAAVPPVEAPANVTVDELGPGLWRLAGQTHNSVLVEFADHLTLIEAPMNETRTLAVIAKARELRPGKPLTTVVVTHHHFDHTGGLRAAVAEGLTVVAHRSYERLFRDLVERKHTLVEDVLTRTPRPLMFQGVEEELLLKDAMNEVGVYNLSGNTHVEGLLMAYMPRQRVLYEADVFGTYLTYPFARHFYDHLQKRRLRVETYVPTHGDMKTHADLLAVLPK